MIFLHSDDDDIRCYGRLFIYLFFEVQKARPAQRRCFGPAKWLKGQRLVPTFELWSSVQDAAVLRRHLGLRWIFVFFAERMVDNQRTLLATLWTGVFTTCWIGRTSGWSGAAKKGLFTAMKASSYCPLRSLYVEATDGGGRKQLPGIHATQADQSEMDGCSEFRRCRGRFVLLCRGRFVTGVCPIYQCHAIFSNKVFRKKYVFPGSTTNRVIKSISYRFYWKNQKGLISSTICCFLTRTLLNLQPRAAGRENNSTVYGLIEHSSRWSIKLCPRAH